MQILLSSTIVAILLLPVVQNCFNFIPRPKLIATSFPKTPKLKLKTFLKSGYQKRFEPWFMKNSGLWEGLLLTNNQLNYQFFRQLNSDYQPDHSFMVGNQHSLFQSLYLKDFNGDSKVDPAGLELRVKNIAKLQSFLQSRGKTLLVVTSVNKLSLHPEYVPQFFNKTDKGLRNIDVFRKLAKHYAINHLDSEVELAKLKDRQELPLFAGLAAHWNSVAACHVSKLILEKINQNLEKHISEIACSEELEISPRPLGVDKDLIEVLNVWDASPGFSSTPYTKASLKTENINNNNPRMLFIGTSFLWSVLKLFEDLKIYSERDFYYYGRTNHFAYRDANGRNYKGTRKVKYKHLDWQQQVFDKDVVILEINEARLPEIGFKFLDQVVKVIYEL